MHWRQKNRLDREKNCKIPLSKVKRVQVTLAQMARLVCGAILCQVSSLQHKNPLAHGNKHSLNQLLMYIKPRKCRWFCFKNHSTGKWLWTGCLKLDSVLYPRLPKIKYNYSPSPARYKIHLLNKLCFAPST